MTVIQLPCPTDFTADMQDLILQSADTVSFTLLQSGNLVLSERFSPADGTIRISGLGRIVETCLYGQLKNEGSQDFLSADFDFRIDDVSVCLKTLFPSHHRISGLVGSPQVLSHGSVDVCHPGIPHPLTFRTEAVANLYAADTILGSVSVGSAGGTPVTVDGDPARLFSDAYRQATHIVYTCGGQAFTSWIDHRPAPEALTFRFLNVYDCPETLLLRRPVTSKPQTTDATAIVYGQEQRYSILPGDEYTAQVGELAHPSEYQHWRDLMLARRAEVFAAGRWWPVVILKPNYTQRLGHSDYKEVEFSFRMARQGDILM